MLPLQQANIIGKLMGTIAEDIVAILGRDMTTYAISTLGRALPSGKDGLKVVQRRILQCGIEQGFGSAHPAKVSRWSGQVMADYHPHGPCDSSIISMADEAKNLYPLIYGIGNLGGFSRDTRQRVSDDKAAAARYLKATLTPFAEAIFDITSTSLLHSQPSYDERNKEVLAYVPAVPLSVLNGGRGIATGYSFASPSYNLLEIANALEAHLCEGMPMHKAISKYVLGPDFASGCKLLKSGKLRQALLEGQGSVQVQGRYAWERLPYGRSKKLRDALVVTALPFASAEKFIKQITKGMSEALIGDIAEIRDLSDSKAIRVEVFLARGGNKKELEGRLNKHTGLTDSFNVHSNVLIAHGSLPKLLGVPEMCSVWLDARKQLLIASFEQEQAKLNARMHILDGLLIALQHIDEVIFAIRKESTIAGAKARVQKVLNISELQANAVLSMQLAKLITMEQDALLQEQAKSKLRYAELQNLVDSDELLGKHIASQVKQIADRFGEPRFTELVDAFADSGWKPPSSIRKTKRQPASPIDLFIKRAKSLPVPMGKRRVTSLSKQYLTGKKGKDCNSLLEYLERCLLGHIKYWREHNKAEAFDAYESAKAEKCNWPTVKLKAYCDDICNEAGIRLLPADGYTKAKATGDIDRYLERHITYWMGK